MINTLSMGSMFLILAVWTILLAIFVRILVDVRIDMSKATFVIRLMLDFVIAIVSFMIMSVSVAAGQKTVNIRAVMYSAERYGCTQDMVRGFYFGVVLSFLLGIVAALIIRIVLRFLSAESMRGILYLTGLQGTMLSFLVMVLLAGAFFSYSYETVTKKNIRFNEVCSNNVTVCIDEESGLIADYIELRNYDKKSVSLDDIYISDDIYNLMKMPLGDMQIRGNSVLLITLVDRSRDITISESGETIYLSDDKGNILDTLDVPKLAEDTAYVYDSENDVWGIFCCSPGMKNEFAEVEQKEPVFTVKKPKASRAGGFYEESFYLELYCEEGSTVYYSTDCSTPDENSTMYTEPIYITNVCDMPNRWHALPQIMKGYENLWTENVDKCVVVKAIAIDGAGNKSAVTTESYFVDMDGYREGMVVSLSPDYDSMFGKDGIYVTGSEYDEWVFNGKKGEDVIPNYEKTGRETEVPAHIELFDDEKIFSQDIGIRIFGGSSRLAVAKRFSLFARKEYSGFNFMDTNIFGTDRYKKFQLRSGFANALGQVLAAGRNVLTLETVPVTVFLDGEWYGESFLQPKLNAEYISKKYGVAEDNVVLIKNGEVEDGLESDILLFNSFLRTIESCNLFNYDEYVRFCNQIDVQSYIDFSCANLYLANMDYSIAHNFAIWRTRESEDGEYGDCKWRFIMYDLDSLEHNHVMLDIWEADTVSEVNSFTARYYIEESCFDESPIFSAIKVSPLLVKQFVLTYTDMLNTNLKRENVLELLTEWGKDISYIDYFFDKRNEYVYQHIAEEFNLSGKMEEVTLSTNCPEGGKIHLNTMDLDLDDGEWTGKYFVEFALTLTAMPEEGYEFVGWSGSIVSEEAAVELNLKEGGAEVYATFRKITE